MSNIAGSLGIKLTADASGAKRVLKDVSRDLNKVERQLNHQQRTWKNWSIQSVAATVAIGVAVGATARRVLEYSDALQSITNKLKITTNSQSELNEVTEKMFDMATENRSNIEGTVDLYTKLHRSTKELGMSTDELTTITDTIQKSFIIGGATSREMEGAVRQLGQALASGALRGEEFNSVSEQAPLIMEAVKEATGKNAAELRKLAAEGAITTEILVRSLELYRDKAVAMFAQTEATFAQNMENARTELIKFISENESVQEIVRKTGESFLYLAENIDVVAKVVGGLAAIYGGVLVNSLVKSNAVASIFLGLTGQKIAALRKETEETARQSVVIANKIKNELNLALHTERTAIAEAKKAFQTGNATKAMKKASLATSERIVLEEAYLRALGRSSVAQAAHTNLAKKDIAVVTIQNSLLKVRNFLMGNWVTVAAVAGYAAYTLIDWETKTEKQIKATNKAVEHQIQQMGKLSDKVLDTRIDVNTKMQAKYTKELEASRKKIKELQEYLARPTADSRKKKELKEEQERAARIERDVNRVTLLRTKAEEERDRRATANAEKEKSRAEAAYLLEEQNAQRIIESFNEKSKTKIQLAEEEKAKVLAAINTVAEAESKRAEKEITDKVALAERLKEIEEKRISDREVAEEESQKRIDKIRKNSPEAKAREQSEKYLQAMRDRFKTEEEMENARYQRQLEKYKEHADALGLSEAERKADKEKLEQEHQERMRVIKEENEGQAYLDRLRERFATEAEMVDLKYEQDLERLKKFYDDKKITDQEYADWKKRLEEQQDADRNLAIAKQNAMEMRSKLNTANSVIGIMKNFGGKSKKLQKALFVAEKAVAIGRAVTSMNLAIAQANALPPPANIAAVAQAKLTGALAIAGIAASAIGGRSGASTGGGGSSSFSGSGSFSGGISSAGGSAQVPQASRNISINLTGGSLFSADQVRELIGQINEQVGDGVNINTGG